MSQSELDSNYSKIVALRNIIMSSSAELDTRLQPITETAVGPSVPPPDTAVGPKTPDMPIGPNTDDDTDAIVDYEINQDIIDTSGLEGVGTERASAVDPAEVTLFLNSNAEAKRQMFNQFSKVAPGNGLGSMQSNPLRQHNAITDAKQYAHTLATAPRYNPTLGRNYNSPVIVPSLEAVENKNRNNSAQPYFINTIQNNFGKV
jgi:hypothetical protein